MAPVDGLGGEGVSQAVGVHVVDAGDGADAGDDAVHGAAIDRVVVIGEEPAAPADVLCVGGGPLCEQVDDFGVEGDHAVVAELADWDAQPVAVGADAGDGVGGEFAELGGAQPGAGQDLGDEPVAVHGMVPGGGHERGGLLVGEEPGDRLGAGRDVAVQDRVPSRSVGPVPFDEPLQEDPDHPQPVPLGVLGQQLAALAGLGSEPHLVVLDMGPGQLVDDGHVGFGGEPAGQLSEGSIGDVDALGCEEGGELQQIAAHRGHQLRCAPGQDSPLAGRRVRREPRLDDRCGGGGHRLIACMASSSAAASASIRSAARRYSEASQSSERCS
jgi:hypothetical protein